MHPAAVGTDHALRRVPGVRGDAEAGVGGHGGRDRVQPGIAGGVRDRALRRATAGRALWPVDPDGAPGTRVGGPVLRALWRGSGVCREAAAGDPDVHCAAGGRVADAAGEVSRLHVSGIVAVVLCARVPGHEAGRELAVAREILPSVRCGDWRGAGRGHRVVPVVALAESAAGGVSSTEYLVPSTE